MNPDPQTDVQPVEGIRSKPYKFFGPSKRPTKPQYCACGYAFTTYWAHRETKHHKDMMRKWRKDAKSTPPTSEC